MLTPFQLESKIETLDQKEFILYLMDLNLLKKEFLCPICNNCARFVQYTEIVIVLLGDVCIISVEHTKNILICGRNHFLKILEHLCELFLKF